MIQLLPRGFPELNWVDMSAWGGELTDQEAECMRERNIQGITVGTGHPNGAGTWAPQQAKMADKHDLLVDAYIYEYLAGDVRAQTIQGMERLGSTGVEILDWWNDVEDVSAEALAMSTEERLEKCRIIFDVLEKYSHGYYGAGWYHVPYLGNTFEWANKKLWDAYYPRGASVDNAIIMPWEGRQYGGFSSPVRFQYCGTSDVCGQSVDLNFDTKWSLHLGDREDLAALKNIVGAYGYRGRCTADVAHLFPPGTPVVAEEDSAAQAYPLVGDNAIQFMNIRGISLGLSILNQNDEITALQGGSIPPSDLSGLSKKGHTHDLETRTTTGPDK